MKHVSIIVPAGKAVLSSVIGPFKVLNAVNDYLLKTGLSDVPAFKVDLVGLNKEQELYGGAFAVRPTKLIEEVGKTDIIIVATITGDIPLEIENNRRFVEWIREMRSKNGAEVASLCMGAFLLAETGLLNGKTCATHWMGEEAFRLRYPEVNLIADKIITEDDGIYSSGGAYSFLNLILHLVEKNCGKEVAVWCAKMFEIEYCRESQGQFIIFHGQKNHGDETIVKAQGYIEENIAERISIEELANRFSVGRRSFIRRFKKATMNTPLEYIQRAKIEFAKRSLEVSRDNVSDVMYAVGYNDMKAFRNTFRKHTGLSPKDYKQKYSRN